MEAYNSNTFYFESLNLRSKRERANRKKKLQKNFQKNLKKHAIKFVYIISWIVVAYIFVSFMNVNAHNVQSETGSIASWNFFNIF